jgi:hypothetical protein
MPSTVGGENQRRKEKETKVVQGGATNSQSLNDVRDVSLAFLLRKALSAGCQQISESFMPDFGRWLLCY